MAKKWVKVQDFDGFPMEVDFKLKEESIDDIKNGGK